MSLHDQNGSSGDRDATGPISRIATSIAELTCADVRAQINELIDGSLSSPALERVERHIQQCADCAALQRSLEQTVQALNDVAPVRIPGGMRDRLRQRLTQQPTP